MEESVRELVAQRVEDDRFYRRGRVALDPKVAVVIDADRAVNYLGLKIGEEFILEGEAFLPVDTFLGKRTVFFPEPIQVGGSDYYLEIKGYGRNGQELYPRRHDEGDLYFGLFLAYAKREFYIPQTLRQMGVKNIQLPGALLKFDPSRFITYSSVGLAQVLHSCLSIGKYRYLLSHPGGINPDVGNGEALVSQVVADLTHRFITSFDEDGLVGIANFANQFGLKQEVDGISEDGCGYVIRLVRSPIRVGDLHDPSIVTEQNKLIARQVGSTVRQMLELGYWHLSPNPGNWTSAGELVDFADVAKYPGDLPMVTSDAYFRNMASFNDYIKCVFGPETVGYLASDFQAGFMDRDTSTQEVLTTTKAILKRLERDGAF